MASASFWMHNTGVYRGGMPHRRFSAAFFDSDLDLDQENATKYAGTVWRITNSDPDWPHSPYECIEVRYDDTSSASVNEEIARLSPWEMKPLFSDHFLTEEESKSDQPDSFGEYEVKCPTLDSDASERIANALSSAIEIQDFQSFQYPVDQSKYPDYAQVVPVPIDLSMITQRLKNDFYRQIEAVERDIEMIHSNCVLYNLDESPIAIASLNLVDFLKTQIWGAQSCVQNDSEFNENESQTKVSHADGTINSETTHQVSRLMRSQSEIVTTRQSNRIRGSDRTAFIERNTSTHSDKPTRLRNTRGSKKTISDDDSISSGTQIASDEEEEGKNSRIRVSSRISSSSTRVPSRDASRTRLRSQTGPPEHTGQAVEGQRSQRPTKRVMANLTYADVESSDVDYSDPNEEVQSRTRSGPHNSQSSMPSQSSRRLCPDLKKKMLTLLNKLEQFDKENFGAFLEPVPHDVPGYYEIITNPMDYSTARKKLMSREYASLDELVDDLDLIYSNCDLYNEPTSVLGIEAKKQRKLLHQTAVLL